VSLFAEIRSAAATVMERARFVRIDRGRLEALARELAEELAGGSQQLPALDPAHHLLASPEATLAFVVTLDAVNFGSGWFPRLVKLPGCSGYMTVATRLKEHFVRCGPWSPTRLAELDFRQMAEILGQDADEPEVAELMRLFAQALADLGRFLEVRCGGSFEGLMASAGRRAERLVSLLAEMPFYRDVARYGDLEVPFYKRAQITAADLAAAFDSRGFGHFVDIDSLTSFADNLVPHVLRCERVLHYQAGLAERIDSNQRLEAGSPEEIEIRAAAVNAVEGLVEAMATGPIRSSRVTARCLDSVLWNRGQRPAIKAHPRHRTRCVFY
jgi:hypothetical protein